jgi:hypothetical protein
VRNIVVPDRLPNVVIPHSRKAMRSRIQAGFLRILLALG